MGPAQDAAAQEGGEMRATKQRTLPRENVDRLQALGDAVADMLEDEATPGWLFNSLTDLTLDADNRARGSRGDGVRCAAVHARRLFAETVLIAEEGGGNDDSEE